MAYTPYYPGGWRNKPDLSTSIRAEALQHMEDGIEAAHDALTVVSGGGSSVAPTAVKTSAYSAAAGDLVPADASSAPITITLPSAPADKAQVVVKKIDTSANAVAVACGGSDVFNKAGGSTSLSLTAQHQSLFAQYQASTGIWYVIAVDPAAAQFVAKSLGTAKGDLIGFSASGTPVRIPGGGDGSVPTYDSTAAGGISAQAALNASSLLLGATNGALKRPWGAQAFVGPELWSATYFDTATVNSIAGDTSTTPSLTGNSTAQHKMTRLRTGYVTVDGQVQETYRFDFTLNNTCPSGWAGIAIRALTIAGATVPGTEVYLWGSGDGTCTNYRSAIDFTIPALASSGARYIEVEVFAFNNVASGTVGLSNVSLRQVAASRPSLNVSWLGSNPGIGNGTGDGLQVDVPVVDPVTGVTQWLRKFFGPDGVLKISPATMTSNQTYTHNYVLPSTTGNNTVCASGAMTGTSRQLHIGNVGQIMGVVKSGGSTELRCNTHGGEWGRTTSTVTDGVLNSTTTITSATANFTLATHGGATVTGTGIPQGAYIASVTNSTTAVLNTAATATASGVTLAFAAYATNFIFEMDFGDGTWVALTDGKAHACRRARITTHTQVTRSDQTTPFANVDNTFTIFDDGTVRFDRTITFVASQQMWQWFYFMHSFDTTVLEQGRMGFGQQVLTGFDPRQYLTAPVAATASNSASGGTYGSLTRTYFTTAITPQGETLLSPGVASTTSSGTTNSFTVTQPATQTGQTGWAIYDSTGLLARLPVATTTWVDTGPVIGSAKAPTVNTATVLPGTQQYVRLMSDRADWAAFYDSDSTNVVFGTITDRDNALSYPGATSLTCELDSHPGVLKNYWQLQDGSGYRPVATAADEGSYRQTITNGTVLTTTAYSFTYAPLDRANWHREIANRGQGFKQFNTVYPST